MVAGKSVDAALVPLLESPLAPLVATEEEAAVVAEPLADVAEPLADVAKPLEVGLGAVVSPVSKNHDNNITSREQIWL